MKKKLLAITLSTLVLTGMTGCASFSRGWVDFKSDMNNGLKRTIVVYTADGQKIASYKGKIDIQESDGFIKFDYKGKRYIYYNCFVESIADID